MKIIELLYLRQLCMQAHLKKTKKKIAKYKEKPNWSHFSGKIKKNKIILNYKFPSFSIYKRLVNKNIVLFKLLKNVKNCKYQINFWKNKKYNLFLKTSKKRRIMRKRLVIKFSKVFWKKRWKIIRRLNKTRYALYNKKLFKLYSLKSTKKFLPLNKKDYKRFQSKKFKKLKSKYKKRLFYIRHKWRKSKKMYRIPLHKRKKKKKTRVFLKKNVYQTFTEQIRNIHNIKYQHSPHSVKNLVQNTKSKIKVVQKKSEIISKRRIQKPYKNPYKKRWLPVYPFYNMYNSYNNYCCPNYIIDQTLSFRTRKLLFKRTKWLSTQLQLIQHSCLKIKANTKSRKYNILNLIKYIKKLKTQLFLNNLIKLKKSHFNGNKKNYGYHTKKPKYWKVYRYNSFIYRNRFNKNHEYYKQNEEKSKRKNKKRSIIAQKNICLKKKLQWRLKRKLFLFGYKSNRRKIRNGFIGKRYQHLFSYIKKGYKTINRSFNFIIRHEKRNFISLNPRFWIAAFKFGFRRTIGVERTRKIDPVFVFNNYHLYPWLNPILYKRRLYRLTKYEVYLRLKRPSFHKRNQIYHQYTKTFFNRWNPVIKKKRYFYLKTVLSKIILAMYGHIKLKQFKKIVKSNNRIKPRQNTRLTYLLNHFERRLDVLIYRLNFAPTIQWARELIRLGMITVGSKIIQKPNYLVENFSIIQYACNKKHRKRFNYFFNKTLLKKTVPSHLLTNSKLAAGILINSPNESVFTDSDRVNMKLLNTIRLINNIKLR